MIVDGEVIIENGHSTRVDEEELYARAREASRNVLQRMERNAPADRGPHTP